MPTYRALLVMLALTACDAKKQPSQPAAAPAPAVASAAKPDTTAAFWNWFTAHADELRADQDLQHTMERINAELEKANRAVFAEIGKDGDNRTLVLTADGKKDQFPAVQALVARRPTAKGWTIVAFRQRGDLSLRMELGGKTLDPHEVKFVATPAGAKLDLRVFIPGFTTIDEMGQLTFVLLDHVVGEYDMETRIGEIDLASTKDAPATAKPLSDLPTVLDALPR